MYTERVFLPTRRRVRREVERRTGAGLRFKGVARCGWWDILCPSLVYDRPADRSWMQGNGVRAT